MGVDFVVGAIREPPSVTALLGAPFAPKVRKVRCSSYHPIHAQAGLALLCVLLLVLRRHIGSSHQLRFRADMRTFPIHHPILAQMSPVSEKLPADAFTVRKSRHRADLTGCVLSQMSLPSGGVGKLWVRVGL